jgi:hypothetical protein
MRCSLELIMENIKLSPIGTLLEKCLLAEEMYFNIGDRLRRNLINGIKVLAWSLIPNYERRKIETDLIAEYGSATVF